MIGGGWWVVGGGWRVAGGGWRVVGGGGRWGVVVGGGGWWWVVGENPSIGIWSPPGSADAHDARSWGPQA